MNFSLHSHAITLLIGVSFDVAHHARPTITTTSQLIIEILITQLVGFDGDERDGGGKALHRTHEHQGGYLPVGGACPDHSGSLQVNFPFEKKQK